MKRVPTKSITKTFNVLKTFDSIVEKADLVQDDGSIWAIASCENVDSSGDIVRAAGLDYSEYHNPPVRHLKILANHLRKLPDGTPPIIGRVEEFRLVTMTVDDNRVPALIFRMTFADSPLADSYRRLMPKYLDSFSIGFNANEADCIPNQFGGYDIQRGALFEISAVTIPCLPSANVLREIKRELGEVLDEEVEPAIEPKPDVKDPYAFKDLKLPNGWLVKRLEGEKLVAYVHLEDHECIVDHLIKQIEQATEAGDFVKALASSLEPITASLKTVDDGLAAMSKGMNTILDRLDTMESAMVVLSAPTKDKKPDNSEYVKAMTTKAESILKFLDK